MYLPGGYPELHAQALSQASEWQDSMRQSHALGTPILSECGGMMALAESLSDQQGKTWKMAGLLPGRVVMQQRLAALGAQSLLTEQGDLRGHTFHYSRFETELESACHTLKQHDQVAGEAVYRSGNLQASYFHAYFPSNSAATAALFLKR